MDKHALGDVDSDALARLAKLGEALTDEQVDELVQLSEDRQDGKKSRREFAKAVGALGLGGLLGGGGAASMTGTAKADASTTDADGNVGRPNNRVDVFADGVNSKTVNTDELAGSLTNGNSIDNLVGTGLKVSSGMLYTDGVPGAVSSIQNPSLDSNAGNVETIIFRDEFFLTEQSFANKVEVGLEDTIYDRSSNTIGDGTPDGNFSSVSTDSAVINTNEVYVQGNAPSSPDTGDIWIDNDG